MTNISLKDFRSFTGWQNFNLSDLTLLTGTNNSGKSSLLSAIRILKDGLVASNFTSKLNADNWSNFFGLVLTNIGDRRVGGFLSTFVNRDAKVDGEFSYSFLSEYESLRRSYETILRFRIDTVNQDSAKLVELMFRDCADGTEFLSISKNDSEALSLRVDFAHFAMIVKEILEEGRSFHSSLEKINRLLKDDDIDEKKIINKIYDFEKRYKVSVSIKVEDNNKLLNAYFQNPFNFELWSHADKKRLKKLVNDGMIYDFNRILEVDSASKKKLLKILSVYNLNDTNESIKALSSELCAFLSQVEWVTKSGIENHKLDDLLEFNRTDVVEDCISLKRLLDLFGTKMYLRQLFKSSPNKINIKSIKEFNLIKNFDELLNRNPEFIKSIFIPLLDLFVSDLNNKGDIDFEISPYELVIGTLIHTVLGSLNKNILNFYNSEFITSSRGLSGGLFRNTNSGEFNDMLERFQFLNEEDRDKAMWFITKWLKDFGIADNFILNVDPNNRSFNAYLEINGAQLPLTEFGYGTIQLIPLLLGITLYKRSNNPIQSKRILIVEEPESNLHPALQSKLADMFIEAIRIFEIQLLVETHSEYLIRKLQYFVAKEDITSDSIIIYYFNKADERRKNSGISERVKKISINSDGFLSDDFGPGFFDEATNISIALFGLNRDN